MALTTRSGVLRLSCYAKAVGQLHPAIQGDTWRWRTRMLWMTYPCSEHDCEQIYARFTKYAEDWQQTRFGW